MAISENASMKRKIEMRLAEAMALKRNIMAARKSDEGEGVSSSAINLPMAEKSAGSFAGRNGGNKRRRSGIISINVAKAEKQSITMALLQ